MEGVSTQVIHRIHSYWKRRSYQRLDSSRRQTPRSIRLGGGAGGSSRRCRKVKVVWRAPLQLRRLRLLSTAPLRLLGWIKNAYMDAMLSLAGGQGRPSVAAGSRVKSLAGGGGGCGTEELWGRRMPRARQMSARSGDFERRMMQHILNSIVEPEVVCSAPNK